MIMKIDVDCSIDDDKAEISISLLDRISRKEFDEFADMMRREGFKYDPYSKSNFILISRPKMLSAMLKFLEKEFQVSGILRGKKKYSWDERNKFVQDFSTSLLEDTTAQDAPEGQSTDDSPQDAPEGQSTDDSPQDAPEGQSTDDSPQEEGNLPS
jgi:hypothetical protein